MDSYKQLKLKIAYIIKCTAGLNIDIRDDINIGRLSIINSHIQDIGHKINTTFSTQFSEKVLLQSSISQIAEMIMNPGMAMYKEEHPNIYEGNHQKDVNTNSIKNKKNPSFSFETTPRIIELANNYPTDSDILSGEETGVSAKIALLENKKTDITQKIKDLGIIQKPNITGYIWLLILISIVLICIFSVITIPIIIIDLAVYLFILKKMKKKYEKWELASDALIQELNEIEYGLKKAKAKFKSIQTIRREVLLHLFHTELGFPIRTLKDWEYVDARQKYLKLKTKKEELAQMPASAFKTDLRIAFFNDKLLLFLEKSIQHEAITTESLQMFQKAIADNIQKEIRKDLSFKQLKPDFINTLRNDNETMGVFLNELIANFNEALEMDTSGLFCKHDSSLVEKQTNELETIYKNTIELANEYTHSLSILNEALGICRLVAYRNIYLGAELLNIVRDNAGGGKLTVASDTINYSTFDLDFSIQTEEYSLDESVNQVLTASCDAVIQFVEIGMKDKNLRKYASKNPKHAVAAVATVAAFNAIKAGLDAWDKRNAKIESLLKKDEIIFENMERVIAHMEGLQSLFERAVEMITALVKCGQGFRTIYDQLYPRIFIDKNFSTISMKELQELALAIGEYKKYQTQNYEKELLKKTSDTDIIQLENNNYEEYLEPDYTPSTINKIECYATLIEQNRDLINDALNLGNHIADVYLESKRLNAQVESIKSVNQVKLANIVAKYKVTQQVIEKTFAERRTSLSHFYKELDAAIESNDTTRILNAMKMIGSIVVTSPLADIQNFVAKYEDTSQPLLDF